LNIHFENVNLNSTSGPNSFANKLVRYFPTVGVAFNLAEKPDAHLCFIETAKLKFDKPMFQRLDGIYFNTASDYKLQNRNIKRTYDLADGVIFQSEFNKQLISKYFGTHSNSIVIHNGADLTTIKSAPVLQLDRYENLWSCAASWRPHKRLGENIKYFLEHSGDNDGLIVAGAVSKTEQIKSKKIHYVGNLTQNQLYSLYKKSKYFIHLAWLDHCPNVVVDARACGCQIICSSAGGTKEIAGKDATIIKEPDWDFEPVELYNPPKLDFSNKMDNIFESEYSMSYVAQKYFDFMRDLNEPVRI
tara:strand:- start:17 stop:922 length:906 start_codon:yes stop_codon:yes gene_type:complete